jgi:hypothetical protein
LRFRAFGLFVKGIEKGYRRGIGCPLWRLSPPWPWSMPSSMDRDNAPSMSMSNMWLFGSSQPTLNDLGALRSSLVQVTAADTSTSPHADPSSLIFPSELSLPEALFLECL